MTKRYDWKKSKDNLKTERANVSRLSKIRHAADISF